MKPNRASAPPYCTETVVSLGHQLTQSQITSQLLNPSTFQPCSGIRSPVSAIDKISPILHSVSLRCAPLLVCVLLAFNPQARGDESRANGKSEILNCACSGNFFGVNPVGNILQNSVGSVLTDQKSVTGLRLCPVRRCEKSLSFFSRRYLKPQSLAASQPVSHSTFFKTPVTCHLSIPFQDRRGDRRPDTFPLII
jgi:hypothetical protein